MRKKGILGPLYVIILFVVISFSIILFTEGLKIFSELAGYDSQFKVIGPKYDRNNKYKNSYNKDVEVKSNKLSPKLITSYYYISQCAYCKFIIDHINTNEKKMNKMTSHGICAECYKKEIEAMGFKLNKIDYDKMKIKMNRSIRMGWAL